MAGFLEKNLRIVTGTLERALSQERSASRHGLLQSLDTRLKIVLMLCLLLACSLTGRIGLLLALNAAALLLAALSGIGPWWFIRRVWIFIPLFTGLIALPALFLVEGNPVATLGPLTITGEGLRTAVMLVLRVSSSVSFAVLLVLTTRWDRIMDGLRGLFVPQLVVSMLSICYRYLHLLLRSLDELLTARRSRIIRSLDHRSELLFASRSAGFLFLRSLHLADDVHMAMRSRGHDDWEAPPAGGAPPTGDGGESAGSASDGAARATADASDSHAFAVNDLSYSYRDGIAGVKIDHLEIEAGVCTVLLGPNGSGKSTLLRILDGLIHPQHGSIHCFGEPITEATIDDRVFQSRFRARVGLVFQDADIQCFSPTVRHELEFGPRQRGLPDEKVERRVYEAMRSLRLDSLADRYPYRLSGGEKKRVAIASVLTTDPDILLMDEPTANLDPATEGILIDLVIDLMDRGKTLVIATQDLLLARHIGDRAVVLGPGKRLIASGPIDKILADRAMLESAGLTHRHRAYHPDGRSGGGHTHYTEKETP